MNHHTAKGFTLIELMIVITIIAILAVIAWPSYEIFAHKTHLESARADLLSNALAIEKQYTKVHSFANLTNADLSANKSQDFYNIRFFKVPDADSYTLAALPKKADDPDYLTYNSRGGLMKCVKSSDVPANGDDCESY